MKTLRQYITESEARLNFIKSQPHNQNISMDHDPIGKGGFESAHGTAPVNPGPAYTAARSAHVVDKLASHDPHPEHKHTDWMVRQYKKGHIRLEDGPRVNQILKDFNTHKAKLPNKDINSYKHVSDVHDAVEPHLGTLSGKAQARAEKHEGAELIHSEGDTTVHRLKTEAAAKHYGKGTQWCTAGENHNMFKTYHEQGPLYVVQTKEKSPIAPGGVVHRKHQFHFQTGSFMDEKDRPVDVNHMIKQHPELKNVQEFKSHGVHSFPFMEKSEVEHTIKSHIATTPPTAPPSGSGEHHYAYVHHENHVADLHKMAEHMGETGQHQHLFGPMAAHGLPAVRYAAAVHGPKVIQDKLVKDPSPQVRSGVALSSPHPEHHEILAHDMGDNIHNELFHNPHTSPKALATIAGNTHNSHMADAANFRHFQKTGKAVKTTTGNSAHPVGSYQHYSGMQEYGRSLERSIRFSKESKEQHPDSTHVQRAKYAQIRMKHLNAEFQEHYPGIIKHREHMAAEISAGQKLSPYMRHAKIPSPAAMKRAIYRPGAFHSTALEFEDAVTKGFHKPPG